MKIKEFIKNYDAEGIIKNFLFKYDFDESLNELNISVKNEILSLEDFPDQGRKFKAYYDNKIKTIVLSDKISSKEEDSIIESFCHEFGHYIWCSIGFDICFETYVEEEYKKWYVNKWISNGDIKPQVENRLYQDINILQHENIAETFKFFMCNYDKHDEKINEKRYIFIETLLDRFKRNIFSKLLYKIVN